MKKNRLELGPGYTYQVVASVVSGDVYQLLGFRRRAEDRGKREVVIEAMTFGQAMRAAGDSMNALTSGSRDRNVAAVEVIARGPHDEIVVHTWHHGPRGWLVE